MKIFGYIKSMCVCSASLNRSMLNGLIPFYMNIVIDLAYTLQTVYFMLERLRFRFP